MLNIVVVDGVTKSIRGWGITLGSAGAVDNNLRRLGGTAEEAVKRVMKRVGTK